VFVMFVIGEQKASRGLAPHTWHRTPGTWYRTRDGRRGMPYWGTVRVDTASHCRPTPRVFDYTLLRQLRKFDSAYHRSWLAQSGPS
jgi:hypothetical protein